MPKTNAENQKKIIYFCVENSWNNTGEKKLKEWKLMHHFMITIIVNFSNVRRKMEHVSSERKVEKNNNKFEKRENYQFEPMELYESFLFLFIFTVSFLSLFSSFRVPLLEPLSILHINCVCECHTFTFNVQSSKKETRLVYLNRIC